jgi:hypothetical protein
MALERELQAYKDKLPDLPDGKYALIAGETVEGTFDSYQDALADGYRRHSVTTPFLVKQISPVEIVASFTRDVCPT